GNPTLPALHGGVIAGFMEHSAMLHLLMFMGIPHLPKIIDFSIDYLRAGHYRDTFVQCQVWRQGRRVANVAITAWQTNQTEPIATARAHFKVDEP
ncbi:MAG: PaaI family thioesterase, partial [Pseudomonas sp.]|nr:PaaI family thioesterase [Pseudomonas sp.]